MTIKELYIYEVAHKADSVTTHREELANWGITPDFVGLELPSDGEFRGYRTIFKYSPAAAIVLYLFTKLQMWLQARGPSNATRNDAEFEAGRQFAAELGVPAKNVDRKRSDVYSEYFTWPRRFRDSVLFAGGLTAGLFAIGLLAMILLWVGMSGLTLSTIGVVLFWLFVVVGLLYLAVWLLGRVGAAFTDGIRDARDEMMFAKTVECCQETGGETALIIAGKRHSRGIADLAADREIDVQTRSAPSLKSINGDSYGWQEAKTVYLEE